MILNRKRKQRKVTVLYWLALTIFTVFLLIGLYLISTKFSGEDTYATSQRSIQEISSVHSTQDVYTAEITTTETILISYARTITETTTTTTIATELNTHTTASDKEIVKTQTQVPETTKSSTDVTTTTTSTTIITTTAMPEITESETTEQETQEINANLNEDIRILALAIQKESNGSTEDSYGVASVIVNRVASQSFPNSIREVLQQPGQYSWASSLSGTPSQWAIDIATDVLVNGNTTMPYNVVYQAPFIQGSGVYKKIGVHYYCYE